MGHYRFAVIAIPTIDFNTSASTQQHVYVLFKAACTHELVTFQIGIV
jgi:hypothetical protein